MPAPRPHPCEAVPGPPEARLPPTATRAGAGWGVCVPASAVTTSFPRHSGPGEEKEASSPVFVSGPSAERGPVKSWALSLAHLRPGPFTEPCVGLCRSPPLRGRSVARGPQRRLSEAALRPCSELLNQNLRKGGPATPSTPSAGDSMRATVHEARSTAAGFPGAGLSCYRAGWSPGTRQVLHAHFYK